MNTLPPELDIYQGRRRVGSLRVEGGVYRLDYDREWLATPDAYALSLRLPLSGTGYAGREVEYFFDNLLPEERVRHTLAQKHGVTAQNTYALLSIIGRECAGAFSILPQGERPPQEMTTDGNYLALSLEQVGGLLRQLPANPMLSGEGRVSLSLAGAQNKISLLRKRKKFYLPQDGAPSNCILKPAIAGLEDSGTNELYCLRLAKAMGLAVAQAESVPIGKDRVLCIDRYDRILKNNRIIRLHQEDFCQVLGLSPTQKYEKEGGPSFAACADAIRRYSAAAAADLRELCRWAVFNVCIGNADAHGKNLSFLHTAGGTRLAPFYDMLSTTVYDRFDDRMAMSIGGAGVVEELHAGAWASFASALGIAPTAVKLVVQQICRAVPNKAVGVADKLIAEGLPPGQVNPLLVYICQRTRAVKSSLDK